MMHFGFLSLPQMTTYYDIVKLYEITTTAPLISTRPGVNSPPKNPSLPLSHTFRRSLSQSDRFPAHRPDTGGLSSPRVSAFVLVTRSQPPEGGWCTGANLGDLLLVTTLPGVLGPGSRVALGRACAVEHLPCPGGCLLPKPGSNMVGGPRTSRGGGRAGSGWGSRCGSETWTPCSPGEESNLLLFVALP